MTSRFAGLLLCLATVTGCQNEVSVEVRKVGEDVVFVATRGGRAACIDEVRVYAAGDRMTALWTLIAPGKAPCRSEFTYGRGAPGFMEDGHAPRLRAGAGYVVSMDGPGWIGQADFTKSN